MLILKEAPKSILKNTLQTFWIDLFIFFNEITVTRNNIISCDYDEIRDANDVNRDLGQIRANFRLSDAELILSRLSINFGLKHAMTSFNWDFNLNNFYNGFYLGAILQKVQKWFCHVKYCLIQW